jgi:hypothetical protein
MDSDAAGTGRHELPVTVEAVAEGADGSSDWAGSVVTRTERHQCGHRLWFQHLNTAARVRAVGGMAALAVSWTVIAFGCLLGVALLLHGAVTGNPRSVLLGLLLVIGTVLELFGAIAFASVWRRPHRPPDAVLVAAAVGFLVFLTAAGVLVVFADLYVAPLFAVPFAVVLWQLFWFRQVLYGRDSCRTFPGYAPAVRAMLEHDPGPHTVS